MDQVRISCIAYRLGERATVADLPLETADRERLLGVEGGLRHYRVSTDSCLVLAIASARETLDLARHGCPGLRIDVIVIASNSLATEPPLEWTLELTLALNLPSAPVYFINGGDCCNFQAGSRFCHALVSASPQLAVLFVTVDRVADVCPGRFLAAHGAGINSDGAASCLFAANLAEGFRMGGFFAHAQDASLLEHNALVEVFPKIMTLARSVFKQLYAEHGLVASQIGQVLAHTHTHAVSEMVGLAARVPLDKVFRDNIAATGHCFAADNLINLHCYAASPAISNEPILVVGSGVRQWAGFMLERVGKQEQRRETS